MGLLKVSRDINPLLRHSVLHWSASTNELGQLCYCRASRARRRPGTTQSEENSSLCSSPAPFTASPFCPHCLTWSDSSLRGRTTCCGATEGLGSPTVAPFAQITFIIVALQGYHRGGAGRSSHRHSAITVIYRHAARLLEITACCHVGSLSAASDPLSAVWQ